MFQILSTPQSPSLNCHCLLGSHKRISLPTLQSLCPSSAHNMPLLDGSHSSANTATNHLEVLHRAACRVITGCLSSTPSSLLLLEAQLPPLKLTLEHQTLYSFERALRLPPTSPAFMPGNQKRSLSTKEETLPGDHSVLQHTTTPIPRESLITCPPFPPWSTTHFTVFPFIPYCTGSSTARLQIASSRLSSLPRSDIQVWIDGSVSSLFGPVALECMQHAPNATHPIPYPFPPVQLPPASQLKPLPSSKVLLGVLAIDDQQIPVSSFPNRLSISPLYPFFSPLLSPA